MKFEEFQSICEKELQTYRLADIARELNVTPQVVNNWKSKNLVPYKYVQLIRKKIANINKGDGNYGNTSFLDFQAQLGQNMISQTETFKNLTEEFINFSRKLIKKNYIILCSIPSIFALLSIYYALGLEPIFISQAKILPSAGKSSSNNISGIAAQFGFDIGAKDNSSILSASLYPEIIMSRTLSRNLLYKQFKSNRYSGRELPLIDVLMGEDTSGTIVNIEERKKKAIRNLSSRISVSSSMKSPLLFLTVKAFEPKLASDIAQAIINELNEMQKSFKTSRLKEKRLFIENRIKDINIDLSRSEEKLKVFRERNREIKKSPSLRLEEDRLKREVNTQTQVFLTLKSQYEIVQIEEVEQNDMVDILDPPESPLLKSGPNRRFIVISSTIFGLLLSLIVSFFKDLFEEVKLTK